VTRMKGVKNSYDASEANSTNAAPFDPASFLPSQTEVSGTARAVRKAPVLNAPRGGKAARGENDAP
jgi:hypothetical protein